VPPSAPPDQYADFLFPVNGLDLYQSFMNQRPGTTPVGLNVRAYEPGTQRARGGARPGLSKWIPPQLPSGAHVIQHLNYIVDPTPNALDDQDSTDTDAVNDPTTNPPGSDPNNPNDHTVRIRPPRKIRKGGTGSRPNRNRQPKHVGIKLVQAKFGGLTTATFTAPVHIGNLIVVEVINVTTLALGQTVSVTDDGGNHYVQAGPYVRLNGSIDPGISGEISMSFWYTISSSTGPQTITATGTNNVLPISISEFSGVDPVSTLDQFSAGFITPSAINSGPFTMQSGNVGLTAAGGLVVAAFCTRDSFVACSPFSAMGGYSTLSQPGGLHQDYAEYLIGPPIGNQAPQAQATGAFQTFQLGLAISFKAQ
jgi:hypothetical protein